jgi:hypothetical protein
LGETVEDCISLRSGFSLLASGLLNESVVQGRVKVNTAAMEACAAVYDGAECGDPFPLDCLEDDMLEPLVPLGGVCGTDYECLEGYCTGNAFSADGLCELPRENGAACDDDLQCASGACHFSDDVCFTPGAAGTPCTFGPECASGLCDMTAHECLPEEPEEATCSGFAAPVQPSP